MVHFRKGLKLAFSLFAAIMILAAVPGSKPAMASADTFTANQKLPFDLLLDIPCANGGVGETVELSGTLNDLYHITFTSSGSYSYKYQDNPQGVSGTGLTTGEKFQATGVTNGQGSGKVGFESTYINNFRIIGQNTGNNFLVHETQHFTVNANGTLTAYVDNFSVECK